VQQRIEGFIWREWVIEKIVFAWQGRQIRVITARDMTHSERRFFDRK